MCFSNCFEKIASCDIKEVGIVKASLTRALALHKWAVISSCQTVFVYEFTFDNCGLLSDAATLL